MYSKNTAQHARVYSVALNVKKS